MPSLQSRILNPLSIGILIAALSITVRSQLTTAGTWSATAADKYEVFSNLSYRTVGLHKLTLDMYVPYQVAEHSPTLIWFHGGGWTRSSKETEMLYILPYLEAGWIVANVEYRLASVERAPAAVEDCQCAVRWIASSAAAYKVDPEKLVVSGTSAGGHLALATAILPGADFTDCGKHPYKIAAVINWFGPSDVLDLIEGSNSFDQAIDWIGNRSDRREVSESVSPIRYVRKGLPPIITIHGDRDKLIPYAQSIKLHAALTRAGVSNRLVTVRGGGHGEFDSNQTLGAYREIRNFLISNRVRLTPDKRVRGPKDSSKLIR